MRTFIFDVSEPPSPDGIPHVVRKYLSDGAAEGSRNKTLFDVSLQLRDMGMGEEQIVSTLSPRAMRDGLKENEIRRTIRSAMSAPPREAPKIIPMTGAIYVPKITEPAPIKTGPIKEYVLDETPLPEVGLPDPVRTYLKALFRAGERIQIVRGDNDAEGKERPSTYHQVVMDYEKWMGRLDKADGDIFGIGYGGSDRHGLYVAINPLKGDKRRATEVTAHRHALIEFDTIPKNHQWQLIVQSEIPCVAVVDSGGKSIHAIVRIDAKDKDDYDQRVKILYEHFKAYGLDEQNKDCVRLSRLPGAFRGDTFSDNKFYGSPQKLLAINIGKLTFAEWHQGATYDHDLPPKLTVSQLRAFDRAADPDNLIGNRWITKGNSCSIIGPSGIGKSSLVMQFAICLALGREFFGIKAVRPLKVMIIQAENDKGDLAESYQDITSSMGLTEEEHAKLEEMLFFRSDSIHTGKDFINIVGRLIEVDRPDVAIADPLLAFCGADISKQDVVGTFLRNQLGSLLKSSGVAWFWVHHTGKPKDPILAASMDLRDAAYSGLGSSELTNWNRAMIVVRHIEDETYSMGLCKRGDRAGMTDNHGVVTNEIFIKHAPDRICWERVDDSFDVEDAKARLLEAAKVKAGKHVKKEKEETATFVCKVGRRSKMGLDEEKLKKIHKAFLGENVLRSKAADRLEPIFPKSARKSVFRYLDLLIEDGTLVEHDDLIGLPDAPEPTDPTLFQP